MKVRISNTLIDQCEPAIEDAERRREAAGQFDRDSVYLKINAAKATKRGVEIEVTSEELAELRDRFEFEVDTALDNIEWSGSEDRGYWLGRLNAARAFLRRTAGVKKVVDMGK